MSGFSRKTAEAPLLAPSFSTTTDERLVTLMPYFIANISLSKERECRVESDRENTYFLAALTELKKRIDTDGIHKHPAFVPFHEAIINRLPSEDKRIDASSRDIAAEDLASVISKILLNTVTAGRPLPLGSEFALKAQL